MSTLRQCLILSRDIVKTKEFYEKTLGLVLIKQSESVIELDTGSSIPLIIQQADTEAVCSSGYSPFLNFNVLDMDACIPQMLTLGGVLDGPIRYPAFGKVASIRTPDGNMLGLFEPAENE